MDKTTSAYIASELKNIRQALTVIAVNLSTDKGQITKHSQTSNTVLDRLVAQAEKDIGSR